MLISPDSHTHVIQSIEEKRSFGYTTQGADYFSWSPGTPNDIFLIASYHVVGRQEYFEDPANEYTIHVLNSTADDKHNMQLDPTFIPSPSVNQRLSHSFRLTLSKHIV